MSAVILILIVIVFIALPMIQIRKQNQRMKQIRQFQDSLQPGMVVQMTSGIQGRVAHVGGTTIDLEVAPAVITTWDRAAVLQAVDHVEAGSQQGQQLTGQADNAAGTGSDDAAFGVENKDDGMGDAGNPGTEPRN